MRTLMAVLADRAEEVNGKGSVIGIFQAVTARRFPTTMGGVLALRFSLDDEADAGVEGLVIDTRLMGPDGTRLATLEIATFAPPKSTAQPLRGVDVTVDLRGTLLPVPGVYRFEVWCDDTLHAIVPLAAWLTD